MPAPPNAPEPVQGAPPKEISLDNIPDPEGEPIIPPLIDFTPAIFVPIAEDIDLQDPVARPSTEVERIEKKLKATEHHIMATRNNTLTLCVRERERIFQEGRCRLMLARSKGEEPGECPRGLEPFDLNGMIMNMEAPPDPRATETVANIPRPKLDFKTESPTLRHRTSTHMMHFAAFAADAAEAHDAKVVGRRQLLEAELRAEQAKEEQVREAA
ncbi:hypothetical protein ACJ41O_004671 [Fusarium nematophilum]